jgi:hypothetical protein
VVEGHQGRKPLCAFSWAQVIDREAIGAVMREESLDASILFDGNSGFASGRRGHARISILIGLLPIAFDFVIFHQYVESAVVYLTSGITPTSIEVSSQLCGFIIAEDGLEAGRMCFVNRHCSLGTKALEVDVAVPHNQLAEAIQCEGGSDTPEGLVWCTVQPTQVLSGLEWTLAFALTVGRRLKQPVGDDAADGLNAGLFNRMDGDNEAYGRG